MIYLIIYLVGYFLALSVLIKEHFSRPVNKDELTLNDFFICLLFSLGSWIIWFAFEEKVFEFFNYLGNIVLWKKKRNKKINAPLTGVAQSQGQKQ